MPPKTDMASDGSLHYDMAVMDVLIFQTTLHDKVWAIPLTFGKR
jgi:hypothetical protein